MERTHAAAHALEHRRLAHPLQTGNRAFDEAGDEPSFRLDERDDLGADPELRGRLGRGELDRPVDPEQVGVLPRDPQHEVLAVDLDLQVVVRDAAAENLEACGPARPHALDLGRERHARIRSPLGIEQRLVGDDARHPFAEDLDCDLGADAVLGREIRIRDRLLDRVAIPTARDAADQVIPDSHRLRPERDGARIVECQAAKEPRRLVRSRQAHPDRRSRPCRA